MKAGLGVALSHAVVITRLVKDVLIAFNANAQR